MPVGRNDRTVTGFESGRGCCVTRKPLSSPYQNYSACAAVWAALENTNVKLSETDEVARVLCGSQAGFMRFHMRYACAWATLIAVCVLALSRLPHTVPSPRCQSSDLHLLAGPAALGDSLEQPGQPRWVILLTMCFRRKSIELQLANADVYLAQLNRWLKETNFHIFVVESSGTPVNLTHPRLSFLTFDDPERTSGSSSILEANALIFAARELENYPAYHAADYILKVTGRYYFEDLEQVLRQVKPSKALYLQRHRNAKIKWQNSEYFGIRKEGLQFLGHFVRQQETFMETGLYLLSDIADWDFMHPPNKGFSNKIARGGDKLIINPL